MVTVSGAGTLIAFKQAAIQPDIQRPLVTAIMLNRHRTHTAGRMDTHIVDKLSVCNVQFGLIALDGETVIAGPVVGEYTAIDGGLYIIQSLFLGKGLRDVLSCQIKSAALAAAGSVAVKYRVGNNCFSQ